MRSLSHYLTKIAITVGGQCKTNCKWNNHSSLPLQQTQTLKKHLPWRTKGKKALHSTNYEEERLFKTSYLLSPFSVSLFGLRFRELASLVLGKFIWAQVFEQSLQDEGIITNWRIVHSLKNSLRTRIYQHVTPVFYSVAWQRKALALWNGW